MKISVLGAGSWGTAIACHLARHHKQVTLWARDEKQAQMMQETDCNQHYLPDVTLPKTLKVTANFKEALLANHLLIAVPSHAFSKIIKQLPKDITSMAWLTKGLEPKTASFLSDIALKHLGAQTKLAIISGPSFAKELAHNLPTAITIASNKAEFGQTWQKLIHYQPVRAYQTDDLIGVQIAATIKNVLAIATGISDGLAFGANARAALITRGLTEMSRLGVQLGAEASTFYGLAGLGDLVLTCTDNQSRNRRFGLLVGQGKNIDDALAEVKQVVEGYCNAELIYQLAKKHHTELPICEMVYAILYQQMKPKDAVQTLLNRPPKEEESQ